MHELAIAESIVEVVREKAAECGAARVKSVRLKIGEASGIVIDSLTFCFEMLASFDPILTGTQLTVDRVSHRAWCPHCKQEFPVTNFIVRCPTCEEWSSEVVSGTELQVLEMEIENS
ncbi:MAG TPA: hydrogenase maturation nickel metallochaperone HypA [Ktedonobacteraceae bacterium]|nr:hydrogenase maturation nickel metallochaperone HypA [Ktedonobacteraceae bacterium]